MKKQTRIAKKDLSCLLHLVKLKELKKTCNFLRFWLLLTQNLEKCNNLAF